MPAIRHHVIFSPSAAGTLKQALTRAGRADEVLCPLDDFSFGPIATSDPEFRIRWVEEKLGYCGWREITDQSAILLDAFGSSAVPTTAWISRREAKSYAGFLWWLSYIGKLPISIIEVPELSSMGPDDMVELLDQASPFSSDRRRHYQNRWEQLKIEDAPLRIIAADDLISTDLEHFDETLVSHATPEWQKMARIVAGTLAEFFHAGIRQTSDLVLGSRLSDLAEAGRLEWRGDLSHMQHCELRLPNV